MGRLNRGEQRRRVIVYELVAVDSCDVVINGIARDKKDCVATFLSGQGYAKGASRLSQHTSFILNICFSAVIRGTRHSARAVTRNG